MVDSSDSSVAPDPLRICTFGGDDVAALVGDGAPLRAAIVGRCGTSPAIEVRSGPGCGLDELMATVADWKPLTADAHVIIRSVEPDIATDRPSPELGAWYSETLARFIDEVRRPDATILVVNGSTIDPGDDEQAYRGRLSSISRAIHQLDLEVLRLSMLDGISILDADRILGELGAAAHVTAPLTYDEEAVDTMRRETAAILEDYGWFDERPLLEQRGRRERV